MEISWGGKGGPGCSEERELATADERRPLGGLLLGSFARVLAHLAVSDHTYMPVHLCTMHTSIVPKLASSPAR